MTDKGPSTSETWLKKAEESLQRATDAVSEAWKATEGVRGQAWEAAKHAVDQAAEAIDEGIDAAKATWHGSTGDAGDAGDAGDGANGDATETVGVKAPNGASAEEAVEADVQEADAQQAEDDAPDETGADPAA